MHSSGALASWMNALPAYVSELGAEFHRPSKVPLLIRGLRSPCLLLPGSHVVDAASLGETWMRMRPPVSSAANHFYSGGRQPSTC
eukprot:2343293-Pyramimonas_sp.AAC.1